MRRRAPAGRRASRRVVSATLCMALACAALAGCKMERERALRELQSDRPTVRARAVDTLARLGEPDMLDRLAGLTRDPSARVRRSAVAALGVLGPDEHLRHVVGRLRDADLEVRLAAVRVLGRSKAAGLDKRLVPMLDDESMVVRGAASQALAAMGLDAAARGKARAERELARQRVLLRSADDQVRATATRQLGLSGRPGIQKALAPLLRDDSPMVVREASRAVALAGGARALPLLSRLASSKSAYDRSAAASGISLIPGEAAAAALGALLDDGSPEVRAATLNGLRTGAERERPDAAAVCPALMDPDRRVALEAARLVTARELKCPAQIQRLVAQSDKGAPSQARRLELLGTLRGDVVDAVVLISAMALYRQHLGEATRWISAARWREIAGAAAAPAPAGKAKAPPGKRAALQRLLDRFPERINTEEGDDPLLPPRVSASAVERVTLGLAGRSLATPWLTGIAAKQGRLAAAALEALAEQAAPEGAAAGEGIREVIRQQLGSDDLHLRRAAARACHLLGAAAAGGLVPLLDHKDFILRSRIASCLGRLRHGPAVPTLLRLLKTDRSHGAIEALATLGDRRAAPDLVALLAQDHAADRQGERVAIIQALGKLADAKSSAAPLERELTHPLWQVRLAAAKALSAAGRPESAAALAVCTEDYYARVRQACRASRGAPGGAEGAGSR